MVIVTLYVLAVVATLWLVRAIYRATGSLKTYDPEKLDEKMRSITIGIIVLEGPIFIAGCILLWIALANPSVAYLGPGAVFMLSAPLAGIVLLVRVHHLRAKARKSSHESFDN